MGTDPAHPRQRPEHEGHQQARGGGYGYIIDGGKPRRVIDLSVNDLAIDNWATIGGALPPVDLRLFADPLYGLNRLLDEMKRRAEVKKGGVALVDVQTQLS
ncbi:MAG: hypothetical protein RIB59_15910 [Rhodospirillales bacterium]